MDVEARIARAVVGAVREKDRSGSEIWRWLGPVHGHREELNEQNLYATLYRLEAQGLLEGHWREEGQIRRLYRLTAGGVEAAVAHQWPAIARRNSAGSDDGTAWNFEPRQPTATTRTGEGAASAATMIAATATDPATGASTEPPEEPRHEDEQRQIDAYLAELDRTLALDDLRLHDTRAEIADHLVDMSQHYRSLRVASDEAIAAAVAGLGPASELARSINQAVRTRGKLVGAIRWALAVAPAYFLIAYAVATAILVLATPVVFSVARVIAALLGTELLIPTGEDLVTNTYVLTVPVALFLAARKSTTQIALRSRRSERSVFPLWAGAGCLLLVPLALFVRISLNPVVAAALVAMPLAWIAGCARPITLEGDIVSSKGVALAAVAIVAGMVMPGAVVWTYRAGDLPPLAAAAAHEKGITLETQGQPSGSVWTMAAIDVDTDRWSDVHYEIWPAQRTGLAIVPAPADRPSFTSTKSVVDLKAPSQDRDWYVLVVATDTDGSRRTLVSTVVLATRNACTTSLFGWLTGAC